MFNHPYVCIETEEELNDDQMSSWLGSVIEKGPSGIVSVETMHANDQQPLSFFRRMINGKNYYVVVLARNLNIDEASRIVRHYSKATPNGDFTVHWSQDILENRSRIKKVSEDITKSIALEAAKMSHNEWLREKTAEGWRFSQKYSNIEKTSSSSGQHFKINYGCFLSHDVNS